MRCQLGAEVGYSVRFDEQVSAETRIKFLTDGMLLREALHDPLLTQYSVIMIDEAHERSLSSDILLGLLRIIRRKRPDLRLVVSSATLEAEKIVQFFDVESEGPASCKIITIQGRSYPVDILYLEAPVEDYVSQAVKTAVAIHQNEGPGDVLVFLTGRDEIQKAMEMLTEHARALLPNAQALQPLPLFAGLNQAEQMYVFSPAAENTRKIILSTNVAEASVTIDGVVYVIDCGFAKERIYNPLTNIEALTKLPISQASAMQRAGRAGRTRPGKCYRLYTNATFQSLLPNSIPEIQRSNLAPVILQLKALGIDNVAAFSFLTPPSAKILARGLESLYALDALDDYAKLTKPLGTRMAELALPPMMAKALLKSLEPEFACTSEMLTIAAMCSLQATGNTNIWFSHEGQRSAAEFSRRKFAAEEGDHLTYLNVFIAFTTNGKRDQRWCQQHHLSHSAMTKAVAIRAQLSRSISRFGVSFQDQPLNGTSQPAGDLSSRILKCLTEGYFMNVARMNSMDGTFRPLTSRAQKDSLVMYAHPTSLMFNRKADYVTFHELLETGDKLYIKDISKIERNWCIEAGARYYQVQ